LSSSRKNPRLLQDGHIKLGDSKLRNRGLETTKKALGRGGAKLVVRRSKTLSRRSAHCGHGPPLMHPRNLKRAGGGGVFRKKQRKVLGSTG